MMPRRTRGLLRGLVLLLALLTAPSAAWAQAPDGGHAKGGVWPYALPLWGEKVVGNRGIKLPLPFGVGLNYAFADQPIDITRIAVGFNDGPMHDLSPYLKFGKLESTVHATNLRFDAWVLPFLNVYGMGNYIVNAKTKVSIVEPFSMDAGASQSGVGGGFGFTAAGGVWGFFGTLDLNWTWNKMEKLDKPVGTFLLTPRVGKNLGKLAGVEFIVWVGAMRQVIESKTRGEIRLSDTVSDSGLDEKLQDALDNADLPPRVHDAIQDLIDNREGGRDPVIHYDLDKKIAKPWNMLIGTEVGLSDAWRLRGEVGFIGRTQLVLGVNYRFGGPVVRGPKP